MLTALAILALLIVIVYPIAAIVVITVRGRKAPVWALFLFAHGARIGAVGAVTIGLFCIFNDAWLVGLFLLLKAALVWCIAGHDHV